MLWGNTFKVPCITLKSLLTPHIRWRFFAGLWPSSRLQAPSEQGAPMIPIQVSRSSDHNGETVYRAKDLMPKCHILSSNKWGWDAGVSSTALPSTHMRTHLHLYLLYLFSFFNKVTITIPPLTQMQNLGVKLDFLTLYTSGKSLTPVPYSSSFFKF